ncbi:hypothetical protein [Rathayibacter iranicus]|uniref:Uncharacterized protein n=1 Tax=Rathayibacter iranicus NCPPB 2253 = VKM Ac-1602 TaxID=1328868 RepID=A0ABX5LEV8_9MICO|nr:hypothetical protein [Rathayibacter iranicus]PWJ65912.1 hypothetical protein B0H03_10252 [Rathayibacter iranicus NCPPB 2253 = VKM Ac-1602]
MHRRRLLDYSFGNRLCVAASRLLQHNAFELKPPMLINTGYQLVMFLAMAVAIGLL